MPTTTELVHPLAALIAAERQASDDARRSAVAARSADAIYGGRSDEFRRANEVADNHVREMWDARVAVDRALMTLLGAVTA